jgi:hypothetical protein
VPVPLGAANVQGVRQLSPPLPKVAWAPGGTDDTCTGMPGELKPGTLKLGILKLGTLKLGMLGIPVQPDKAAPLSTKAIARRIILIPAGPKAGLRTMTSTIGICA